MVHLLEDIHLSLEPLNAFWVINGLLLDKLSCSLELRNLRYAAADLSIGAFSQLFLNFIVVCELAALFFDKTNLRNIVHMRPTIIGDVRSH